MKKYFYIQKIIPLIFAVHSSWIWAEYEYLEQTSILVQKVEEDSQKHFDDEVLQQLYEYRIEIEKKSYLTTLQLCSAYHIVTKYSLEEYRQNINSPYVLNHPDPEVQTWTQQILSQQESLFSSSLKPWSSVAYEGGVQPLSALFGLKADYLNQTHAHVFEIQSWFQSLYSLFLVRSPGFLKAAGDCLGTEDSSEIDQFASTILIFDSTASLPLILGTGGAVGVAIKGLIKAVIWTSRPLVQVVKVYTRKLDQAIDSFLIEKSAVSTSAVQTRQVLNTVKNSISKLSSRQKKWILYSGLILGGTGFFYSASSEKSQRQKEMQEGLLTDLEKERNWEQVERALFLKQTIEIFELIEQETKSLNEECWECLEEFLPFLIFLEENFNEETWNVMEQDLLELKEKTELDFIESRYLANLEKFLQEFKRGYKSL